MQLFITIVLYAGCVCRIFMADEMSQEVVFPFLQQEMVYRLTSIFLLTINTFVLIFVMRKQKLIELRNYYPALIYLLLSCVFSDILNPPVLLVGLVFTLNFFGNLFDWEESNINRKIFRYGFCVGVLALLYFPLALLLFFVYWMCIILGRVNFRSITLPILGLFLPFLYWYSALYVLGYDFSFQQIIPQMGKNLLAFSCFEITESAFTVISTVILLLICFKSFYSIIKLIGKMSVFRRKKYYILLILFLFSMIFAYFYSPFYWGIFLIASTIVMSLRE